VVEAGVALAVEVTGALGPQDVVAAAAPRRGGEEWRWGVRVRMGRVEFIYDSLNGLLAC
jgi:hypothetical protein